MMDSKPEPPMYCWGGPLDSRKFHIFHNGRSLCMKWMYFNVSDEVRPGLVTPSVSDCKECGKRWNKMLEK